MFEHHSEPLAPTHRFVKRLIQCIAFGIMAILVALIIGMCGYHYFEGLNWIDSFLNAAMILSGMGPLDHPGTVGGKIFAGCYALFSGLAFILIVGIVFSPVIHRFFHKLHLNTSDR